MGKMVECSNCRKKYFRCSDDEGTLCNSCKVKKEVFLDGRNEVDNGSEL